MPYLMRHGESEANVLNMAGTDMALTANGRQQAMMAELPQAVSCVLSSTLRRARETAGIVADRLGLPLSATMDAFDEIRFGMYDGRVIDDWFESLYQTDLPALCRQVGGDDPEERAKEALALIREIPDDVLIVTSDTLLRCMMGVTTAGHVIPLEGIPQIGNCAVVRFGTCSDEFCPIH